MSDEIAIGIDLGTSNSCVAVSHGRQVEVLRNSYGEATTASVVAFREDGSIVVGNAAKAHLIHDPHHTVSSAKRLIGRYSFSHEVKKARRMCSYKITDGENHSLRIGIRDEEFAIPEISAMVLREMKSIAEARLGHEVHKAVVTVPAYFNDNQRQATKDAGRIAGLEVLRLLNEPTAAALSFGFGRGLNQRVAIYDLGGGTFDISILEIGTDVFEVLATFGDTYLGGDDFDERIITLLADEFSAKENIDLREDAFALEKLKLAAENAKKGLSMDDQVEINIPEICVGQSGEPRSIQRTLNQGEFTSLVMDLIQRTFKVCDEALQCAGVIARDLDGVVLVGGPTRLPVIKKAVGEYFQQEPKAGVDPDQVVAMGAAIHAASLTSPKSKDAYLLDVTPLSLKIGVAGGLAETVIDRNTPVPIEQSRNFTTVRDYQKSVQIQVYQGESRRTQDNELLGQFEFSGFETRPRGDATIEVTFEINGDGIVNVTARDPESGQQASTEITLSSGLSEEQIQEIIARGRAEQLSRDVDLGVSSDLDRGLAALPVRDTPVNDLDIGVSAIPAPPPRAVVESTGGDSSPVAAPAGRIESAPAGILDSAPLGVAEGETIALSADDLQNPAEINFDGSIGNNEFSAEDFEDAGDISLDGIDLGSEELSDVAELEIDCAADQGEDDLDNDPPTCPEIEVGAVDGPEASEEPARDMFDLSPSDLLGDEDDPA